MKKLQRFLLRSKLTFVNPETEDLGIYSVAVTDTDGVSSSYSVNDEGQRRGSTYLLYLLIKMKFDEYDTCFLLQSSKKCLIWATTSDILVSCLWIVHEWFWLPFQNVDYLRMIWCFFFFISCSTEDGAELWDSGEGSCAFLGPGSEVVLLCQLQVHRQR